MPTSLVAATPTMDEQKSVDDSIEEKLKLLILERDDTLHILRNDNITEINAQTKFYEETLNEIRTLQRQAKRDKVRNGVSLPEIKKWDEDFTAIKRNEEELYYDLLEKLKVNAREEEQKQESREARAAQVAFAAQSSQHTRARTTNSVNSVRLPKLAIAEFKGTHLDWYRFWSQFEASVENADIAPVLKFSHLKESLPQRVRLLVDGLPLTTEGYERAKNILKSRYGQITEVVNAHVQKIIDLPTVAGSNPNKVYKFYENLVSSVQTLESLGKLHEIKAYVRVTLDKLVNLRSQLVQFDDNWKNWEFGDLVESLRKWTERNPCSELYEQSEKKRDREALLQTKSSPYDQKSNSNDSSTGRSTGNCVYCDSNDHRTWNCNVVTGVSERRVILSEKRLCFNCTGSKHKARECQSHKRCQFCKKKHHSSICEDRPPGTPTEPMLATNESTVVYPTIVVSISGIKCRALLDACSGSSYASSALVKRAKLKLIRQEHKSIEMMFDSANKTVNIYEATVSATVGKFTLPIELSEVDKPTLLNLPNPRLKQLVEKFSHLEGVDVNDDSTKEELPIHVVLGTGECTKIKTPTAPRVGEVGQPTADFTKLGWFLQSPGKEDLSRVYLTNAHPVCDYEELCKLDVLGLQDREEESDESVLQRFREQLQRDESGRYETDLLWKETKKPMNSNEKGSLARLNNQRKRLEGDPELYQACEDILQQQLADGIIEVAGTVPTERIFYMPHKAVVRKSAESTKTRMVFDASAKENAQSASLNDSLEIGPPLQNLLWEVIVRNRFNPVALLGDMKQAFLQIGIREGSRDALRFHWYDRKTDQIVVYRFCRLPFGLGESPFILGATVKEHIESEKSAENAPIEILQKIDEDLYVDDLTSGDVTVEGARKLKSVATESFKKAGFELHKWNSNVPELDDQHKTTAPLDQTYAKEQLGVSQQDTKILGVYWLKSEDVIGVKLPDAVAKIVYTKRGILVFLASIYDPLGIISPCTLIGKVLYRDACDSKLDWDDELPEKLRARFSEWIKRLPQVFTIPRSIPIFRETIDMVVLHVFGDASVLGVSAVVYAVVIQKSGTSQGLVASKSRLAKKGQTIPRLELIACHMAVNLLANTRKALSRLPLRKFYAWTDSTIVLHWVKSEKEYKPFVNNRVRKIRSKPGIELNYVNTKENPADIGSRGCHGDELSQFFTRGPNWLPDQSRWPEAVEVHESPESEEEAKRVREILALTTNPPSNHGVLQQEILKKYPLRKTLRILGWIHRFVTNCRLSVNQRKTGFLSSSEIRPQMQTLIRVNQSQSKSLKNFSDHQKRLNLQPGDDGVLECRGRLQGDFPIYLHPDSVLAMKLIELSHLRTLHGGVGLTMTDIRMTYWIPRLRQLVRSHVRKCKWCRRFHAKAFSAPVPGLLPTDRSEGDTAFRVIGVDYAGPFYYKKGKQQKKVYLLINACSLSRAIHLELLDDQTADGFIRSFKKFVARRGLPKKVYSDNARTFQCAAKWLKNIITSEQLQGYLTEEQIEWHINLSRAPWWGGQFERLIRVVKQSLYKTVGRACLKRNELEEVILDLEIHLNNRPLSYVEDDIELPIITPNALMFGIAPKHSVEDDLSSISDRDLRKRAKYVRQCKEALWKRWKNEYVRGLREQHNMGTGTRSCQVTVGDVVTILNEDYEKNRAKWNLGIVDQVFPGRDGVVRSVRLRAGKSYLDRPVQKLYPLEMSVSRDNESIAEYVSHSPSNVAAPGDQSSENLPVSSVEAAEPETSENGQNLPTTTNDRPIRTSAAKARKNLTKMR